MTGVADARGSAAEGEGTDLLPVDMRVGRGWPWSASAGGAVSVLRDQVGTLKKVYHRDMRSSDSGVRFGCVGGRRSGQKRTGSDMGLRAGGRGWERAFLFFSEGTAGAPDGGGVRKGVGVYGCGQVGHKRSTSLTGGLQTASRPAGGPQTANGADWEATNGQCCRPGAGNGREEARGYVRGYAVRKVRDTGIIARGTRIGQGEGRGRWAKLGLEIGLSAEVD